MSTLTQIMNTLTGLVNWKNSVTANSKRIDELPDVTTGTKYVAVWNAGANQTQKQLRDSFVNQNNVGRKIILGYFSTNNPFTEGLTKINQQTTIVAEHETPIIFEAQKFIPEANIFVKYVFWFLGGKGTWGQGGTTVTANRLYMLPAQNITVEDINPDAETEIIPLGQLDNQAAFLAAANAEEHNFTDLEMTYYFSYVVTENEGTPQEADVLYIVMFIGDPGIYGGPGAAPDFVTDDFAATTNSGVLPGPATPGLQMVLQAGYQANGEIGLHYYPNTPQWRYQEFHARGLYHESPTGDLMIWYPPNLDEFNIEYYIPKKPANDTFGMLSDINALTFQIDQPSATLSILNGVGEVLGTANLAFLNNEGTTFSFNTTNNTLELKDDAGVVLSSIPVSAFVANLAQSAAFNGAVPSTLDFKDAQNNVVYSVSFAISNVLGLQAALDALVVPDASTTTKGKIKLAKDLGGTAAEPQVVKLSVVADANATQRRAVLVENDGTPVGEETFEFAAFDEDPTGYPTLAALQAAYPSVVNGELIRPQGFRVYCFLMTPPTTYVKCADNDAYWIKHTNTTVV